ncbi:hypothetical protein AKJ09_07919 [Labilithrix luteola]|uniref:Uncharacterized protein n=1 Tax=Labilithrix luteola TaxID=1391654 RepID=A0A0K1Q617_9BACT|nr:hypothetical protein AKJ09_07919 [Labilithrix luteola]
MRKIWAPSAGPLGRKFTPHGLRVKGFDSIASHGPCPGLSFDGDVSRNFNQPALFSLTSTSG